MAALIAAILSRAAGATSFETRPSATAVGASAASPAAAIAATATAERPLEAGARVAADARGIPREIFTWFRGSAGMGCARFSWEQGDFLCGGNRFRG